MIFGGFSTDREHCTVRFKIVKKNSKKNHKIETIGRHHIGINLNIRANFYGKIRLGRPSTAMIPPRKYHVYWCQGQPCSEVSIGGVLLSTPLAPRPRLSQGPSRGPRMGLARCLGGLPQPTPRAGGGRQGHRRHTAAGSGTGGRRR